MLIYAAVALASILGVCEFARPVTIKTMPLDAGVVEVYDCVFLV